VTPWHIEAEIQHHSAPIRFRSFSFFLVPLQAQWRACFSACLHRVLLTCREHGVAALQGPSVKRVLLLFSRPSLASQFLDALLALPECRERTKGGEEEVDCSLDQLWVRRTTFGLGSKELFGGEETLMVVFLGRRAKSRPERLPRSMPRLIVVPIATR
jgi:hypothetical protein